ncbi:MAG: 30S ribosomal protein S27ae [Candidatus Aenigmatarchaeota archaeon]
MKHKSVQYWKYYEIEGDKLKRKLRYCKNCGNTFMAEMKSEKEIRYYCGKCKTTIFETLKAH